MTAQQIVDLGGSDGLLGQAWLVAHMPHGDPGAGPRPGQQTEPSCVGVFVIAVELLDPTLGPALTV